MAQARKPRRTGLFTQVTKRFTVDMVDAGLNLAAAGLYSCMITDPAMTALGYVYRKHEWEQFAESNRDSIDRHIRELEDARLIVADGYHIIVRSYMRRNAFDLPSYLRSGLYDLQRTINSPLLRFVIGAELLRLDLSDMPASKAGNVREAADPLWGEITEGGHLPPVHHLQGRDGSPVPTMVDSLAQMPEASSVLQSLDERRWTVVADHLVAPLQAAFAASHGGAAVTPLRRRTS